MRDSKQIGGRSRARIQLIVLNNSLISHADDDQQHGFKPLHLVQMLCKVMSDSEPRSLNQWVMFTSGDILKFSPVILHIHCTSIVDLVHQWACCRYTSRIIPTTISEGRIVRSAVAAMTRQSTEPLCFPLLGEDSTQDSHQFVLPHYPLEFVGLEYNLCYGGDGSNGQY